MELLAVVLGAFVAGLISWALAGWQHRKQATAALAQLEEQSQIARSHARAEMRLRMQVEEFQELKRIDQIVYKEFIEIDHTVSRLINSAGNHDIGEVTYDLKSIENRRARIRQTARGESRLLGENLSRMLLTATDRWKAFILDPQENKREDARSASLEARRALSHLVEERGRALGAEEDDPLARET